MYKCTFSVPERDCRSKAKTTVSLSLQLCPYCHKCCIILRVLCYALLCNCVRACCVCSVCVPGLLYALKQNCVLGLVSIVKASASRLQARVERTH